MNPQIEYLRTENQKKAEIAAKQQMHSEMVNQSQALEQTVVNAFKSLFGYLEGHTSKTEVVNQLTDIGTPDALKVVGAVNDMHATLKDKGLTDLSPVTSALQAILTEISTLSNKKVEPQSTAGLEEQMAKLGKAIESIEIKAPVVNVPKQSIPTPKVNVDAPNLAPLEKGQQDTVDAIKDLSKQELKVAHANVLISEKFDEWRIIEDLFDEDEPMPTGIAYYLKGKKVAELSYKTEEGRIIGAKKVRVQQ